VAAVRPRPVQLRDPSSLTSEAYVAESAWQKASLSQCPRHRRGRCGFARHDTYPRATPAGMRITRYYCPTAHETFSLLPDCLASRFPSQSTVKPVHVVLDRELVAVDSHGRPSFQALQHRATSDLALKTTERQSEPANKVLELAIEDILFRSPGRPSRKPLIRYKSFHYQADSWTTARRVVAKVEHHVGELFPRVGFIVTTLPLPNRAVVRLYNKRGTAEQWIKEGKQAAHWTRLSCHRFRANEVRLQLSVLAYNLVNLWRRLVLPKRVESWSLTSLQQRLVKTAAARDARTLLLASAGREPSDASAVWIDAPADLGAARADRLTGDVGTRPSGRREGGTRERCPRNVGGGMPPHHDLGTWRALRREIHVTRKVSTERGLKRYGRCRIGAINRRQNWKSQLV
jgi:Transposase DDE domain group 1